MKSVKDKFVNNRLIVFTSSTDKMDTKSVHLADCTDLLQINVDLAQSIHSTATESAKIFRRLKKSVVDQRSSYILGLVIFSIKNFHFRPKDIPSFPSTTYPVKNKRLSEPEIRPF
jgi:hypothetical protein